MLIDERIEELPNESAKKILRRAVEAIAERLDCGSCVMRMVCGEDPAEDECMCRTLAMLAVMDTQEQQDNVEPETEGVVFYDPETMQIED